VSDGPRTGCPRFAPFVGANLGIRLRVDHGFVNSSVGVSILSRFKKRAMWAVRFAGPRLASKKRTQTWGTVEHFGSLHARKRSTTFTTDIKPAL
jgi:hypothetical protein